MLDRWHLPLIFHGVYHEFGSLFIGKSLIVVEVVVVGVCKLKAVLLSRRTLNERSGHFYLVLDVWIMSLLGQVGVFSTHIRGSHRTSMREDLDHIVLVWSHRGPYWTATCTSQWRVV